MRDIRKTNGTVFSTYMNWWIAIHYYDADVFVCNRISGWLCNQIRIHLWQSIFSSSCRAIVDCWFQFQAMINREYSIKHYFLFSSASLLPSSSVATSVHLLPHSAKVVRIHVKLCILIYLDWLCFPVGHLSTSKYAAVHSTQHAYDSIVISSVSVSAKQ